MTEIQQSEFIRQYLEIHPTTTVGDYLDIVRELSIEMNLQKHLKNMTQQDEIELLMHRAETCRKKQVIYARSRNDVNQRAALRAEHDLDNVLKTLRKKGYDPDRFESNNEQKNLF